MIGGLVSLWSGAMDVATGSPEVVARRLGLLGSPGAWSPATAIEAQCMLLEKVEASTQSWWALCSGLVALGTLPAWHPTSPWWLPAQQDRVVARVLGTAQQTLQPVSRQVTANVRRLRRG